MLEKSINNITTDQDNFLDIPHNYSNEFFIGKKHPKLLCVIRHEATVLYFF